MRRIILIIGARPNYMKAFPVYMSLKNDFDLMLIHTGQHFDNSMNKIFFDELKFPRPDIQFDLESKSRAGEFDSKLYIDNQEYLQNKTKVIEELIGFDGTKLGQLGEIRDKLIEQFEKLKPDLIMVFGDVTSTLSASLAGKKLGIEIAHVESGLRSGDLTMPEEVNRILTDTITDYYFVTEQSGIDNLKLEGLDNGKLFLVGNTMIDCLMTFKDKALETNYNEILGIKEKDYVLVTLHRPCNVDDLDKLKEIALDIIELSKKEKIVFPIHPRTKKNLEILGLVEQMNLNSIILADPLGYLEFICLEARAKYIITDSGGIQEETSELGVPCWTLRPNTERPSTLVINGGTNQLINKITSVTSVTYSFYNNYNNLSDGKSGEKICNNILYGNSYKFKTKYIKNLSNDIINNSEIHYKYKKIDFLYKNNLKNNNLFISFHGSIQITTQKPIFNCFNYNIDNCDILSFSDPLLNLYPSLLLSWFLPTNTLNTIELLKEIIENIIPRYKNVLFHGSYGGVYPSLIMGSYFKKYVLINNSQIYLDKYWYYEKLKIIVNNLVDINMEEYLLKYGLPKKIFMYQNINDEHHYMNHFIPFKKFLNKNFSDEISDFIEFTNDDIAKTHSNLFPPNENKFDIIKKILKIQNYKIALGFAYSGPNIGGVRRYLENIEKNSSHQISLYPDYYNDNEWKKSNFNNDIRNNYRKQEIIEKKQEIIEKYHIFHTNVDPTFIKLAEEAQKQGKLWVHTYHNIYDKKDENCGKLLDWQQEINDIQFNIASKADICICVGQWLIDECEKRNIKAVYIPNFIDLLILNNINQNIFKNKYNLDKYILFCGDDNIRKNSIEFINTAYITPQYNFVLIGTNLIKENIEKKYKIKIPNNVILLGPLQHNECLEAIIDCSIFVMNSFTEGLPTVLIEAMYYKKPCIIPNGPEWSKYLLISNDLGYKYELGNINELSNIIINIMTDYKLMSITHDHVIDNYSSNVIINKIDNIYENLMKKKINKKINKKKILFSSLDNKFIEEIINLYKIDNDVKIDIWNKTTTSERNIMLMWADVIFCEWCEINALWYSINKNINQKLYIRLHRYELFTSYFLKIKWENVNQIIFISPEIKRLANEKLLQRKFLKKENFDYEYYILENKNLNIINYNKEDAWKHWIEFGSIMDWNIPNIKLTENINYDNMICDEFKKINGGCLIYNYVKSDMFNNIEKCADNIYNIGIMGILPKIKRLDIAIDIIEYLIKKNNKYKLHVLGKNYKEWIGTSTKTDEIKYYENIYNRIKISNLENNIIFENHIPNPELWFKKIGYILSTSDIEGSHQAVAEGMATGSIPFIYGKALHTYKLDMIYPKKYCFYDDNINLLCDKIIYFTNNKMDKDYESNYCHFYSKSNFNLLKIKNNFDDIIFNNL